MGGAGSVQAPPLRIQACRTGQHRKRHGQIVGTAGERAADGHIGRRIDAREADALTRHDAIRRLMAEDPAVMGRIAE